MRSAYAKGMSDAEWDRHQRIIAEFEAAWMRDERPKIGNYLPDDEPRREELLVELVHADLEFRIKAGESARVEDYLHRYPSLDRSKETVLDLIHAEHSIRRRKEPGLKLDRYRKRFPEYRTELERPAHGGSTVAGPSPPPKPAPRDLPDAETPLPRRFGKFELRERLGLGASGVVFRAWDTVLKREVAVKVPRVQGASTAAELRVFFRDARHALTLSHPNIVEILDAGPVDGVDCMVRAYVEGKTLADRLREAAMTPRESAGLVAVVADAVEHAHSRGIIHRDLKPSNILIDREGRPYVMDFGLSKCESGESTLSPSGSPGLMIGTPAYMSPEQARGETYRVDARSDVYALGVVLYELITGSLPFRGRGRMLQIQIEEAEPIPPRSLNDEVPDDLETICLKALAKDPAVRYQAASDLADDLRRFLDGKPPRKKPDRAKRAAARPWWGWWRRIATVATLPALLLALASLTALWLLADSRRARDAEGLERADRALLDLAGTGEAGEVGPRRDPAARAWDLARGLDSTLDGDPALVEAAADARLKLAGRASAEGSDEAAGPLWDRAILACEASLRERPGRASRLEDLAGALASRAEVARRADRAEDARALFDRSILRRSEALEDFRRRAGIDPDDGPGLDLAEVLFRLAESRRAVGEAADLRQVESIARDLGRRPSSGTPPSRRRLAALMLDLSRWHLAGGSSGPAEEWASLAHRLSLKGGPEAASGPMPSRSCLALARANRDLGRESEALELFSEAARRFRALVGPGPGRLEDRQGLGEALLESGRLLDRPARRAEALAMVRASLNVRLDLDRDYPGAHATLAGIAEARVALARALEAEGRTAPSVANRLVATLDLARAVALAPGEATYGRMLGDATRELARVLRRGRPSPSQ